MATRSIIPVGRLQVATPSTMAASIRAQTEATEAVDERIGDVAVDIIASDANIQAAAKTAAVAAVSQALDSAAIVQSYPETAMSRTGRDSVPFMWKNKTLRDPWTDVYTDTEQATWDLGGTYYGDVPMLSPSGILPDSTIPEWVAAKSDIPEPDTGTTAMAELLVSPDLPIFAARVAKARQGNAPCAIVADGSSTTAHKPGYIGEWARLMQSLYPVPSPSVAQWSTSADFTMITAPGLHVYSAAEGGTTSETFMTQAEAEKIGALNPALIMFMIGANDLYFSTTPAQYRANLEERLGWLDAELTLPTQIVLVHTYPRWGMGTPTPNPYEYPWGDYLAELEAIAETRTDTVVWDLTDEYAAIGVSETDHSDPLVFIDTDAIHQTAAGNRFMATRLVARATR